MQIAKHAGAHPVFGTTSKEAKAERMRSSDATSRSCGASPTWPGR